MTTPYLTIGSDTLKKHWSLVQAAIRGYKPVRNFEAYVLVEADKDDQTLSLRVANQQGNLQILIKGESEAAFIVTTSFAIALEINALTTVLPFLKGPIDISAVPSHDGEIAFHAGSISQNLPWSSTMVEDFPSNYQDMQVRVRFTCDDLGRRLRLGSSSAWRSKHNQNTISAGTFFHINDHTISLISADPVRGVSRMMWREPNSSGDLDFAYVIPQTNVDVLERIAQGYSGEIVITADPGGGMVSWQIGDTTYTTRSLGEKFHNVDVTFTGKTVAEASVPFDQLRSILGLIKAQTAGDTVAKATLVLLEDGRVVVTSPSTASLTSGEMNGMCSGELPHRFTSNATQILDILGDIRATSGTIHVMAQTLRDRPFLRIVSPDDPDFAHIAVLVTPVKEPEPEAAE